MTNNYWYEGEVEITECVQLLSWLHIHTSEMVHYCKCQVNGSSCKMVAVGCDTGRRVDGQSILAEILHQYSKPTCAVCCW